MAWGNLKCKSEGSKANKAKNYIITFILYSGKGKTVKTKNRPVIARDQKQGRKVYYRDMGQFLGVMKLFYDGCYMTTCICQNSSSPQNSKLYTMYIILYTLIKITKINT